MASPAATACATRALPGCMCLVGIGHDDADKRWMVPMDINIRSLVGEAKVGEAKVDMHDLVTHLPGWTIDLQRVDACDYCSEYWTSMPFAAPPTVCDTLNDVLKRVANHPHVPHAARLVPCPGHADLDLLQQPAVALSAAHLRAAAAAFARVMRDSEAPPPAHITAAVTKAWMQLPTVTDMRRANAARIVQRERDRAARAQAEDDECKDACGHGDECKEACGHDDASPSPADSWTVTRPRVPEALRDAAIAAATQCGHEEQQQLCVACVLYKYTPRRGSPAPNVHPIRRHLGDGASSIVDLAVHLPGWDIDMRDLFTHEPLQALLHCFVAAPSACVTLRALVSWMMQKVTDWRRDVTILPCPSHADEKVRMREPVEMHDDHLLAAKAAYDAATSGTTCPAPAVITAAVTEAWSRLPRVQDVDKEMATDNVKAPYHAMICQVPSDDETEDVNNKAFLASCNLGHVEEVRRLAALPDVDPAAKDNEAIICAAKRGYTAVVRVLLSLPWVDPTAQDNCAFEEAVKHGHVDVVRVLAPHCDIARTASRAMQLAAAAGHNHVVRFLLTLPGIHAETVGHDALWTAAFRGHTHVLRTLMASRAYGTSPAAHKNAAIREAAARGHAEAVRCLVADPRVDPAAQDNEAIQCAAAHGHVEVVRVLLEQPAVDPAAADNKAVCAAAGKGHLEVVRALVASDSVDPTAQDYAALLQAAEHGHEEVVRFLVSLPTVDPAARGNRAIISACIFGHAETARFLASQPGVELPTSAIAVYKRKCVEAVREVLAQRASGEEREAPAPTRPCVAVPAERA